jgi:type I site-specific restriction endonuclease
LLPDTWWDNITIPMLERARQKLRSLIHADFTASANQIEFINLIIDHLMHHGVMELDALYESPFTDINAQGPEGMFTPAQVDTITSVLEQIRARAAA